MVSDGAGPPGQSLPPELDAVLRAPGGAGVAVLVGGTPSPLVARLQTGYTGIGVRVVDARADKSRVHAQLAAYGRFRAIVVDTTDVKDLAGLFRNVFLHLEPGGILYFATFGTTGPDVALAGYLGKLEAARGADPAGADWRRRDEILLAQALDRVVFGERDVFVTSRLASYAKMREAEMNAVLELRPGLGEVMMTQPALRFASKGTIRHNYVPYEPHHEVFAVPAMSLRAYADALCWPAGVAVSDQLILPESFRHHQQGRLRQLRAPNRSHFFAEPGPGPQPPVRALPGAYLYLDSEYPGHFGHFVSEIVSRLWGWAPARECYPALKALVSVAPGRTAPPGFCLEVLAAAGIDPADVVAFGADESVQVETLVGATPMLSMPDYVHPDLADVWSRIGENLARTPGRDHPDRIFVRRPENSIRVCHNEADLVARFEAAGFVAVRPETLPLGDQAALFREARVVSGFAGSAMLGLLYADTPKRVILVGPESYTSNNEFLIGAVRGHEIDQIGSAPEIGHPAGQWSQEAFYSDYTFDFDREGQLLDEVLAGLPRRRLSDRLRARAVRPRPGPRPGRRPTR